jgi:hypothetical protein
LAVAAFATTIPGTLQIDLPDWLRGGGALAVFVIVYFYSPAELVVQAHKGTHSELQQTTSQPSAAWSPTPADRSSSMTFDEMKQVLDSRRSFSDGFRRQHQGETVEWTVKVTNVEKVFDKKDESDFLVKIASKFEDPIKSRDFAEAIFPASGRKDMSDVGSGDQIRFRGTPVF